MTAADLLPLIEEIGAAIVEPVLHALQRGPDAAAQAARIAAASAAARKLVEVAAGEPLVAPPAKPSKLPKAQR